jgi:RHS repeat-associated protein
LGGGGSGGTDGVGPETYAYDAGDRLTSVTAGATTTYTYDANGNQTGRGSDTFTWDAEDRLTGATVSGASASYAYRGDGLRHSKTVAGATTTYTWDVFAALPVVLQDGATTYVYGLGGRLVSQTDAAGTQTYVLADGLGSTVALTDGTGTITATLGYDVFGAVRATTGTATTEYRFTGQQDDAALGYTYLRARYYDPATGRFLGKDPFPGSAGAPATQHPYSYAFDNPVNYADPSGEEGVFATTPEEQEQLAQSLADYAALTGQPTNVPRLPDYYSVSVSRTVPNPVTLRLAGVGVSATVDRWGQLYVGDAIGAGWSIGRLPVSLSATVGWIMQPCTPTAKETSGFIAGESMAITAGNNIGGSYVVSSSGTAFEAGYVSPQIGVSLPTTKGPLTFP